MTQMFKLLVVLCFLSSLAPAQVRINGNRIIDGTLNYCADAGASDSYACNMSPALASYISGACYTFKANTANTGAATVNFNSLGAKTIVKTTGGVPTDLATDDIRAGQIVSLCYDGTNMQMQSNTGNASVGVGTVTTVSGTANEITVTNPSTTPGLSLATTFDISGKTSTKPVKTGTTAPATCSVGELFYDTDATAGQNLFGCTATNTWTLQSGGGAGTPGGSNGEIQFNDSGAFGGLNLSTGLASDGTDLTVDTSTVAPMPLYGQGVIDFASISAGNCGEDTVTVTGADAGDAAYVRLPATFTGDLTATAYVSASDTATIRLCNPTGSPIDPASATYGVVVQQLTWVANTIYDVGPGFAYEDIADVPWDSLNPGAEVRIHWRSTPYKEKWHIGRSGTYAAPIRVRGIRNSLGQRPVIDGNLAVAKPGQSYWNEDRGVIKIGGPPIGSSTITNVVIEGLEIYGARLGNNFIPLSGGPYPYLDNAAAIYVEGPAEFIVVRDCYIHENGDGIFASSNLKWMTIEGNTIYKNGYSGSSQEHNSYVEGVGTVYQFNTYQHDDNWQGNNLKDRSAFAVIRYNTVIGGNRTLDIVDTSLQVTYNYPVDTVYGNVLIKNKGYDNNQIIHYGFDVNSTYARRNLRFYYNTIINKRMSPGNNEFVGLKLDIVSGTHTAYNNAFWSYTPGQPNSYYGGPLVQGPGLMTWYNGWIYQGDCTVPTFYCTSAGSGFVDGGGNTWAGSADPYLDPDTGEITSGSSPLINGATAIPNTWLAVRYQFGTPGNRTRSADNDIGAYEY